MRRLKSKRRVIAAFVCEMLNVQIFRISDCKKISAMIQCKSNYDKKITIRYNPCFIIHFGQSGSEKMKVSQVCSTEDRNEKSV